MAISMYDGENVQFKFSRLRRHLKVTVPHFGDKICIKSLRLGGSYTTYHKTLDQKS